MMLPKKKERKISHGISKDRDNFRLIEPYQNKKKVVKSRCPTDKDFKALTEREGLTGEDWPDVVAIQTSLYSDRAKTTEGKYFPARL